ncbi:pyridoxamine 5'-phosphate oxidase family protein [uncultured Desulfuromusa sp.]|uniref:pyridoxamine 5'-phosphate oxidase family protein n=1 Tax=uncultured Desulfuromusa sp. TaxID=219183 RepID=UPI002AA66238|nr:pyridoxamine 5'-phosphate oxidase family protein [uncultured Desulfuromusa sp.]
MRRSDKAVTEQGAIEKILHTGTICQLAFSDEPVPYLVTLNYGYHDGALYFHSAREGRKIDLIRKHGQAAFTVALDRGLITGEKACDWSVRFQSVVGHGSVILIETPEEKRQALDLFMAQYSSDDFSYPDKMIQATAVFKLEINAMTAKQSRIEA